MSYTKQNFTTGQVLKASHLNTMENGIASNADAIAANADSIATNTANIATNTSDIETLNNNLFYNSTETVTYSNIQLPCIGFLTGSNKNIKVSVPLPKRIPSGAAFTLNTFKANIRIPAGGYLGTGGTTISYVSGGTDFLTDTTPGSPLYIPGLNIVVISITLNTAFTTNNIPLSIELNNFEIIIKL